MTENEAYRLGEKMYFQYLVRTMWIPYVIIAVFVYLFTFMLVADDTPWYWYFLIALILMAAFAADIYRRYRAGAPDAVICGVGRIVEINASGACVQFDRNKKVIRKVAPYQGEKLRIGADVCCTGYRVRASALTSLLQLDKGAHIAEYVYVRRR